VIGVVSFTKTASQGAAVGAELYAGASAMNIVTGRPRLGYGACWRNGGLISTATCSTGLD